VLLRRLESLRALGEKEERSLLAALSATRQIHRGEDIIPDGSPASSVNVILSGAACQYKVLAGGHRQILSFLLPGDIANVFASFGAVHEQGVGALTRCTVTRISRDAFYEQLSALPNVADAVWRYCMVQTATFQAWLTNMRRRSAVERMAHLFCEQFVRLQTVGLAEPGKPVALHIAQADFADATGMSSVHVNRTLQTLRNQGLIGRDPNTLAILDWDGLQQLADFDPAYLYVRGGSERAGDGRNGSPQRRAPFLLPI
jgi:CRP-like cAMP-binding protein